MATGRNLFILLLTTLAIGLATLSVFFVREKNPTENLVMTATPLKPANPIADSRPHLTPKIRAEEELKSGAEIQNQIQIFTALLNDGHDDEFFMRIQKEIQNHPDVVEYRALLADFYYLKENWEGAEEALKDVLRLDPQNTSAQTTLGEVIGIQGRYAEGFERMSAVLDRDPNNLDALYGSLSISDLQGTPEIGIQRVTDLYKAHPQSGNIAVVYADVLLSRGRSNERAQVLERAMKTDPQNPAPYRMASMDASRKGDHERAIQLAEESITLDANPDTKTQTLGVLFESAVAKKDFQKALSAIQSGEALQPWNEAWAVRRQKLTELSTQKN